MGNASLGLGEMCISSELSARQHVLKGKDAQVEIALALNNWREYQGVKLWAPVQKRLSQSF